MGGATYTKTYNTLSKALVGLKEEEKKAQESGLEFGWCEILHTYNTEGKELFEVMMRFRK